MGDTNEDEIRKRKMDVYGANKESEATVKDKEELKRKKSFVIYIPKRLFYLSLFVCLIALLWNKVLSEYVFPGEPNDYSMLGQEGLHLFKKYDRNGDDQLSIAEYESLYFQLVGNGLNLTEFEYNPEQDIDEDDQIVTLRAYMQPLLLDSMTKDTDEKFYEQKDSLTGLKEWTKVNHEWMTFGVRHFKVFLPEGQIELGSIYRLYSDDKSFLSLTGPHLSSNRFYPSKVDEKLIILYRILAMFHQRPFLINRFPPTGGVAMVRAYNDDYIEIVYRFHAEFQLNEPPYNPFWFTPGQFTGNLIISRDYNRILNFNIHVPAAKKLNVDMEWLNGPSETENMEVDIGYMPQMMANITDKSRRPRHPHELSGEVPVEVNNQLMESLQNIEWTEEIPQEDALRDLEVKMYPFKQVQYYNFTETVRKAKEEDKLIHSILLWGALDDQSC